MKREFLQGLKVGQECLPKEIIDAIMEKNGQDIQQAKQSADIWQSKYDQAVAAHAAELQKLRLQNALEASVHRAGGRNVKAVAAMLDMTEIAKAQDIPQALDAALGEMKQENPWLFQSQTPPAYARFAGAAGQEPPAPVTLADALREQFAGR